MEQEPKPKKYLYFIGVDVSRNELDFAVQKGQTLLFHKEIGNNVSEINAFITVLKQLPKFMVSKALFCMEFTGHYNNHLLTCLKKARANIVQKDSLFIRSSLGTIRGKYDKIDAIRIAHFTYKSRDELKLWQPKRPIIEQLAHLMSLRDRLLALKKALNVPLKEQETFVSQALTTQSKSLCSRSLVSLTADVTDVELLMKQCIQGDTIIKRMFDIITSVPHVGWVTAVQIIVHTNELRDIKKAKQFACYAGIAPFPLESGLVKKKAKVSHIANKKVKALLHMCACGTLRYKNELSDYYKRKTEIEGKPKMSVLNAIRNKLVLRVFACLSQDRLYSKDYQRPTIDIDDKIVFEARA